MKASESKPTLVLRVSYDGSRYHGYQYQPDRKTVQGCIEAAIRPFWKDAPRHILAAGRTDRGVHATGQVVAVKGALSVPLDVLPLLIRPRLYPSIQISEWALAGPEFHPRFCATGRKYRYSLRLDGKHSPFLDPYSLLVPESIDWQAMKKAACLMEGEHDFTSFATCPKSQQRLRRRLNSVFFVRESGYMHVLFRARSFLRGMIRNIMGALLAAGRHDIDQADIRRLLSQEEKQNVPPPAPPRGLYLTGVDYPDDMFIRGFQPISCEKGLDR